MDLTRRGLIKLTGLLGVAHGMRIIGSSVAYADERQFRHALTLFDDIKYPPGFKHFDYVNPNAPKGGRVRFAVFGSFDSFNSNTYKGDSFGSVGNETLLSSSLDEPSTEYGLIAAEVWHPEDRSSVVFRLRPEARFHDGKPVTVEDAIWSMNALRDSHPFYNAYYKNIEKAEQTGEHEVTFVFNQANNRELPLITGQLPVLPKHWWTGEGKDGKPRNIKEVTLEVPVGSGPYKIASFTPGQNVRLARVKDYWGKDLAVNVGQDNFDEIEYIFYRDPNIAFEAFKADQADWRSENSAKMWALQYTFDAVKTGKVVKEELQLQNVDGMQSWAFNTRRAKFQDPRLRLAFNYAFDFEWSNTNLFYDQYTRSKSFFNNSELAATGLPSPEELAILEPLRGEIPPEVFTAEYANPFNGNAQERRKNLRNAAGLLKEAGWNVVQDGNKSLLKNDKGEILSVEFLLDDPLFERIALPYKAQLELLGITVAIKTFDSALYTRRMQTYDFDIALGSWGQSLSPGNEQREFWGSEAAKKDGSRNIVGISSPAIDKLIDQVIYAKNRADLVTSCRALDRVLLWNHFVVPMWYTPKERIARWDRFSRPETLPKYSVGFPSVWWWDEEKAQKVATG